MLTKKEHMFNLATLDMGHRLSAHSLNKTPNLGIAFSDARADARPGMKAE
jgi:hypothetical protein